MKMSTLFRKNFVFTIVLLAVLAIASALFSGWNLHRHLTDEYQSKGIAISDSIASSSVEILLNRDASTIQAAIDQFMEIEGVSYVYVTDSEKEFISHTFVPGIPVEVSSVTDDEVMTTINDVSIQGMGDFIDVSSPILAGVAGYPHRLFWVR